MKWLNRDSIWVVIVRLSGCFLCLLKAFYKELAPSSLAFLQGGAGHAVVGLVLLFESLYLTIRENIYIDQTFSQSQVLWATVTHYHQYYRCIIHQRRGDSTPVSYTHLRAHET